jgi:SAM-dependent methyltransferase
MSNEAYSSLLDDLTLLCCPSCHGDLELAGEGLTCSGCGEGFEIADGIPLLFWPNEWSGSRKDVTDQVKAFYEETPFPDYDEFDSVGSLIQKARRGRFAKLLDDQVPPATRILDCGCGTGQLSNFLSIANRTVFGADICLNSLRLGRKFSLENGLERAHFLQMNLFRPVFKPGVFDLVISTGVLHHTADPFLAFRSIAGLVKPNGYILIGLYHRYGRLITDLRRLIFRVSRDRFTALDPNLRRGGFETAKRRAWFMDQYKHPHESKHTLGEGMRWLEQTGFAFVNSIPRSRPFRPFSEGNLLFRAEPAGSRLERLMVELGMIFRGSREGGFFLLVGKKRPAPATQKSV